MSLYYLSCTFSCDFIKRMYFLSNTQDMKDATIRTPWHHQEWPTLAWLESPRPWRKHWAPVQGRSKKNTMQNIMMYLIDSYWFISIHIVSSTFHLPPSSIIFYHLLSWGQLVSCSVILQRSLPIRSPAHFTSKPSPTSEAVLRTEYLMNFTVAQWCMVVPTDAYLCLLMPAADA